MGFVSSEKIILENKRGEERAACEQSAREYLKNLNWDRVLELNKNNTKRFFK